MDGNGKLFDRSPLLHARRERAAAEWDEFDFLKREAVTRIMETLEHITRRFPRALDLGCHAGELAGALMTQGRADEIVRCDFARGFSPQVVADEEFLPFASESFDLVASAMSLHHVNDLPGTLIQIYRMLKPGGMFIAMLPGALTLRELREAVTQASATHGFALSPRISPFVEVRDAGGLLQRAKFSLPVADSDALEVEYGDVFKLMRDLRGMGEANVMLERQRHLTTPRQMAAIAAGYPKNGEGGITATFEFVTMTGWKEG